MKIEIAGVHVTKDVDIRNYVLKKIEALEKYLPRHARASAHVEVKLLESKAKDKKQFTAEVILYVPSGTITAKESSLSMQSAVDLVEQKVKAQLRSYKEKHSAKFRTRSVRLRKVLSKFRSR